METSDIKVNRELEQSVGTATDIESIRSLMLAAAVDQHVIELGVDGHFVPAAPEDAPQVFERIETVGGRQIKITGASERELDQRALELFKSNSTTTRQTETTRVPDPVAAVDLELKFKRGEISAAEYIEHSGAVDSYLEKKGIAVNDIKRSLNDVAEIGWKQATDEFLKSAVGADWPGGARNLECIGLTLQKLNLVDAEDKVAALAAAYAEMRRAGTIFEGVAPAQQEVTMDKNATPEELVDAWKRGVQAQGGDLNSEFMRRFSTTGSSSSLFGQQ